MQFRNQEKRKAITFSYDDGITQDVKLINLLNKYGLKGTFNLNSDRLGFPGIYERTNDNRITRYILQPQDVKYVYDGHEVAVHTLTHPNLTTLDEAEVIRQVEQDRVQLSELVGYEVRGMAYPCGGVNNNDEVAKIIKNNTGVRYCRTITSSGNFDIQDNLYRFNPTVYHMEGFDRLMELGEKFISLETDKPQIFYIWGHSYELDYELDYWSRLEEFLALISNKDDIFYGTNSEVLL